MLSAISSLLLTRRAGRWLVPAFFLGVLLLGLAIHRDYGVSWDEPVDRLNGHVNAKYVAERLAPELARRQPSYALIPELATYPDQDHGVVFELPLALLQKLLHLDEPQQAYYSRHLLIFLLYFGGLLAFYGLAWLRFRSWPLALLGTAVLLFTPRLFAEAFYNAKDSLFLAFFTVGMFTLARLLRRPTAGRALWHGVATGIAIAQRVNGVLLLPLTLLGLGLWLWRHRGRGGARLLLVVVAWVVVAAGVTVLGWPYLWEQPGAHFLQAFHNLSHFSRGAGEVLYGGGWVPAANLPWHYVPGWLLITTPLAYVAGFLLGVVAWAGRYLPRLPRVLRTYAGSLDVLTAAWLLGPPVAVILFNSVLYDGWRHLYFIYPAFVLTGLHGLQLLSRTRRQWQRPVRRQLALGVATCLALAALEPLWRIGRDHPQQQVYFSLLAPATIERGYERDYWGLSYRAGLEWVLAHDAAPHIAVYSYRPEPVYNNLQILSPQQRRRLRYGNQPPVGGSPAVYFISNYRWHPAPYPDSIGTEVYQLRVNGLKVLSVFRQPRP